MKKDFLSRNIKGNVKFVEHVFCLWQNCSYLGFYVINVCLMTIFSTEYGGSKKL